MRLFVVFMILFYSTVLRQHIGATKTIVDCKANNHSSMWGDVDPNVFYICDPKTNIPIQLHCPEGRGFFNGLGYYGCIPYKDWPACLPPEVRQQEDNIVQKVQCDSEHLLEPWQTSDPNKFYMCTNNAQEPLLVNCEIGKGFLSVPTVVGGDSTSSSYTQVVGCALWAKWRFYMQYKKELKRIQGMAFSESFGFGSSTFENLESQVRRAIDGSRENRNPSNDPPVHDVILESPTGQSNGNLTGMRSRFLHTSKNDTQKKHWRRSNSDSKLLTKPPDSHATKTDHFTQFFESDFAFSLQEKDEVAKEEALVRVSQFETDFDIKDNDDNALVSALDVPISSEDINGLMETEENKEFSISFDKSPSKNLNPNDVESIPQLDTTSFICPVSNEEDKKQLKATLESGKKAIESMEPFVVDTKKNVTFNRSSRLAQVTTETPVATTSQTIKNLESLKHISAWNLPPSILAEYEKKGIMKMFDWQIECLSNPKVLFEHCNLVYSAPTSAGKTLVSEILLLKTVLERNKKVLMILPFISVVREKMFYLQDLLTPAGYRVEGFFGGYTPPGGFESINVAICTIEKANSIVNKLLEQCKLESIGTVVVDEVHLISDPGRGYILELLLAKILYMSRKYGLHIQIITMSATLANVELLKHWLDAELFITNYRPVALNEMIKVGNKIYDANIKFLRDIRMPMAGEEQSFPVLPNDSDNVAQLCLETILEGCSVIVFCPSKDWCEKLATQLASVVHGLGKSGTELGQRIRKQLNREAIDKMKTQLRDIPTGLDAVLEKTITFGCAFHHAGLTTEERDIVETSFKCGALKIIVATSTLSSGVNLPARRVLIRTPLFGGKQMSSLTYKQMIGRAGRTGKDTLGESILICNENNARVGRDLVTSELKPIASCLEMDGSTHLKRALLEVISSGVAITKADIANFVNCTLLSAQKRCNLQEKEGAEPDEDYINEAIQFLMEYEFMRLQVNDETHEENYIATRLGLACLASSMPPIDGLLLFSELQKCRRCFVLESELHAVYLVTPYSVCYQMQELDWLFFLDLWEKLSPAMKKVGELVGIKESFLVRAMRGQTKLDYKLMQIHKRFYIALALQELVNETPINVVAKKYKCTRGLLQSLQQMASTFAGIVTAFCTALQWDTLSLIVSQFKERLFFGIHRDLIDLMRLPDISHKRARALFDAGITTLIELAHADVLSVEKILHNSLSFDSAKQHENENSFEAEQRNLARNFFITGKAGLTITEAAKLLVEEARRFVAYDIGVGNIKWTQEVSQKDALILHMSYEEESKLNESNKRKPKIDLNETPPKLNRLDDQIPKEAMCTEQKEQADILNGDSESGKILEKVVTETPQMSNIKPDRNLKSTEGNEVNLLHAKNTGKQKSVEERIVKVGTTLKTKVSEPVELQITHTTNVAGKTENLPKTNDVKGNSSGKHQQNVACTKNVVDKETLCNGNKAVKKSKDTASNSNTIQNATYVKKQTPTENKPSISKQIEEEDSRSLDNLSKRKCSKGRLTSETEMETKSKNDKIPKSTTPTYQTRYMLRKSTEASQKCEQTKKTNTTPNQNQRQKILTPPRRSPRNHSCKTLTISTAQDVQDLFANEESFELNSGFTAALAEIEQLKPTLKHGKENISPPDDEIPSSQNLEDSPIDVCSTTPRQTSRFLRSYRTQRLQSPLTVKTNNTTTKQASPKSPMQLPSSNNSDLNDISTEITSSPYAMQMNASHILSCTKEDNTSTSFKSVEIVDICGDPLIFKTAFDELLSSKRFGFCLGVQRVVGQHKPLIGANLLINQIGKHEKRNEDSAVLFQIDDSTYLASIAFCITENIVYYMNMQQDRSEASERRVSTELKLEQLGKILSNSELTLIIYEGRKQLKLLRKAIPCLNDIQVKLEDPKVANWLLQPDHKMSLKHLAQQYAPECTALVDLCGGGRGYNSHGIDSSSAIIAKIRCSIEACVIVHILQGQIENLDRIGTGELRKFFHEVEMPLQLSLCNMETVGFPASEMALRDLFQKMMDALKKLESKIFALHGKRFNLSSASAVGRVLGLHRKPNGRVSTTRQVLEKIDEPIAQLIIAYRKLNATVTNNIQPLFQTVKNDRIHGHSDSFTITGRISMKEPNLQNVAKDFEIDYGNGKFVISCRKAFFPKDSNRCLISADFCQLEMRVLAHMAKDPHLLKIMKSDQDVFTSIAAGWNRIKESEVSEQLRNGTKQICYGIVYGMGMRALSEALKCSEEEAKQVSDQFHEAYPSIRIFTNKIIGFARRNGYVETIQGRRRYLENINSDEGALKSQAERQAVNSAIQGSAADIAKKAILRTEKSLLKYHSKLGLSLNDIQFVLHLHDELIFEVPIVKAKKIAKVISLTMESCTKLDVPLRVKLKMGHNWAEMMEIKF